MLRIIAIIFGIIFIFIGVAGFLPTFKHDDLLFGFFQVGLMHNLVHLAIGVIAIMSATTYRFTVLYFRIFGVLFGLLAIASFVLNGDLSFILMHMNMADNLLLIVVTVIALYLGFSRKLPAK